MNIVELLNQLNFTTLFLIFIVSKLFIETYLKTRNIKSINENKEKYRKDLQMLLPMKSIKNLLITILKE